MSFLEPFDLKHRFHSSDANHDKIEWGFRPGFLRLSEDGSPEDFQQFLRGLSIPDRETRDYQGADWTSTFGWMFNPSVPYRGAFFRTVRKGVLNVAGRRYPRLLFSGKVSLQRFRQDRRVEFWLQINPSRLVYHHPRFVRDRGEPWKHVAPLSEEEDSIETGGEFSLDGNCNWIPDTDFHRFAWRHPREGVERCFRVIEEALESEVQRVFETSFTTFLETADERHSIRKIETYWEFSHSDPVRLVKSLKRRLREFCSENFTSDIYRPSRRFAAQREERLKNSLMLIGNISRGAKLAVYAKTNRRIRFEIRLDLTENSALLPHGYTGRNIEDIQEIITATRRHCASRMNSLFAFLRARESYVVNSESCANFLADFSKALTRSQKLGAVLSILIENGVISAVPGIQPEIRDMKRHGLIERRGSTRNAQYHVASKYRRALEALQRRRAGRLFESD